MIREAVSAAGWGVGGALLAVRVGAWVAVVGGVVVGLGLGVAALAPVAAAVAARGAWQDAHRVRLPPRGRPLYMDGRGSV